MKMVATSYVTQEKTSHSLESLGSENKVSVDPLGTQIEVPVPPIVEKPMVVQTTNLGGEIGSANAPPEVLTQFLPMKRAPTPVIANKPVDSPPSFCPLYTYEDMMREGMVDLDIQQKPPSFRPLSTVEDIRRQKTVDLDIQQKNIETALETVKPGEREATLCWMQWQKW